MLESDGITRSEDFIKMFQVIAFIPIEVISGSIGRPVEEVESWTKEGSSIPGKEEWPDIVKGVMKLMRRIFFSLPE
ncbi:MAG: hypothetical protein WAV21_00250 [Minisyncoccia bacterium]